MAHPLEDAIRNSGTFLLVGDSSQERFPGLSFHNYTQAKVPFYCLDLGGLKESRGRSKGHEVYTSIDELPDDLGELAVIWVKPKTARRAVERAHEAGCTHVWFSFQTGHPEAVARARELAMTVVEIGRCPVYYMEHPVPICRAHVALVKLSGAYGKPPQTDPDAKRRELM